MRYLKLLALLVLVLPLMGQGTVMIRRAADDWTPADISPTAWYDGEYTTAQSGGVDMDDQSGNGYDMTEATEAQRPDLASAHLNGLDCVDFANNNDELAASAISLTQPYTVAFTIDPDTVTHTDRILYGYPMLSTIRTSAGNPKYCMWAESAYICGSTTITASPAYVVMLVDGASSYLRLNGSEDATGNPGTSGSASTWQIADQTADFKLCNLIVTNDALTAGELSSLETYMADRYNL